MRALVPLLLPVLVAGVVINETVLRASNNYTHPLVLSIKEEETDLQLQLVAKVFIELHLVMIFAPDQYNEITGEPIPVIYEDFLNITPARYGFGDLDKYFDVDPSTIIKPNWSNYEMVEVPFNENNPDKGTLSLIVTRRGRVYGNGKYVGSLRLTKPMFIRDEDGLEVFDLSLKGLKNVELYFQTDAFVRGVLGEDEMVNQTVQTSTTTTPSPTLVPDIGVVLMYKEYSLLLTSGLWLVGLILSVIIATVWACCVLSNAYQEGKDQLADEKYFGKHAIRPKSMPKAKKNKTKTKDSKKEENKDTKSKQEKSKKGGTISTVPGEVQKSDYRTAKKSSYNTAEEGGANSNVQA